MLPPAVKTGMQQEYGTANAVYTFIQDKLGVRWLWPGEEDVVPQTRIALAPFELRYHPQIRARAGMFKKLSLGDNKEGPDELWARFQRVQLDSLELLGGHAFSDWWEKYHHKHPDYFALQPDGSRSPHPNPRNTKLCESNPAVWDQWLADVEEQLRADPTRRVFNASENDGYSRPAPLVAVPDDNVIISSVANFHMRGDGQRDTRTKSMQQFAAWSEKARLLMWRPNLGSPVGLGWGMPDVAMTQAGEDFRFVADHHGIGLFFDLFWFHWATQGPHYYALAHLAWNPYADVQAVMDDYYRRAFGPAADDIEAYWTLLERTRMAFVRSAGPE